MSGPDDMRRVHAMRAAADAILVGSGTVLADDPSLRVKQDLAPGGDPIRVVLDGRGRVPPDARVWGADTLVYSRAVVQHPDARRITVPGDGPMDLQWILADLARRGIGSLMVEGGAEMLAAFIDAGLWDEATVYVAPVDLGGGPRVPDIPGFVREDPLDDGVLRRYVNR